MTVEPDCRLKVGGAWFADSADELAAGIPTALATLELTWGRATTVDQPEPATCRVTVLDHAGGVTLLDALPIGAPLEVWAKGHIGAGALTNVAVDGGFEALALGAAGARIGKPANVGPPWPVTFTATVVSSPVATGTRAVTMLTDAPDVPNYGGGQFYVPPAAFTPGNPAGWDAIPRYANGERWQWSITVRAGIGMPLEIRGVAFDNPETGHTLGWTETTGPVRATGDGTFHTYTATTVGSPYTGNVWLGVAVLVRPGTPWTAAPGTWTAAPGTWPDYDKVTIDNFELWAPPASERDVLVFGGRLTDLAVTVDAANHTARAELIATDQKAELENRYVGATPWPAESITTRYGKIIAATGLTVTTRIDNPLGAEVVSKRDVDNQPAGAMLTELAAGVDGCLWSASHATLGQYLWLENIELRVALGTLELVGGVVSIVVDAGNRAPGRTVLDGCELVAEGVTWHRDITDVLTRVDATWLEQTSPQTTEHTVTVVDTAAETAGGTRRLGVATNLTTSAGATAVANRYLARTHIAQWRCEGLEVNCALWPPAAGADTAAVLDLLDGTIRLGRGLIVENITGWPGGDSAGMYLDGGTYRFDGAWHLELATTPMGGFGDSAPWNTLDPTWRWNQWKPTMAWADLYGVTGPLAATTLELDELEVALEAEAAMLELELERIGD